MQTLTPAHWVNGRFVGAYRKLSRDVFVRPTAGHAANDFHCLVRGPASVFAAAGLGHAKLRVLAAAPMDDEDGRPNSRSLGDVGLGLMGTYKSVSLQLQWARRTRGGSRC